MNPFAPIFLLYLLAQWSADPTQNTPVIRWTEDQKGAQVVPDEHGGAVIFWYDRRNGSDWDLYAQHLDSLGYPVWDSGGLPVAVSSGHQYGHRVLPDGSGGAFVVWQDIRSGDWDLYAQHVGPDGALLWGSEGAPVSTASGDQEYPDLLPDGEGGLFVVWEDGRAGTASDIYAQRISAQGVPMWETNGVPVCVAANPQRRPKLAPGPMGTVYVTWYDYRSSLMAADVYLQRLGPDGMPLWQTDGIPVTTATTDDRQPRIVPDNTGGVLIVWENGDLYGQRVDSTGAFLWPPSGVLICGADGNQWGTRMLPDGEGGALLAWIDERMGFLEADIYAQRLSPTGAPLWAPNGVRLTGAPGNQLNLEIAPDDSGGLFVIWQDNRNGATNSEIYAQRVDHTGTVRWEPNGVAVSIAPLPQAFPALASDGHGNFIAAWEDRREDTHWDIYAQRVRGDGTLGGPYGLQENPPRLAFELQAAIRASHLQVLFSLPSSTPVRLLLINPSGRRVRLLLAQTLPAGSHRFLWEWEKGVLPTGLYLLSLQTPDFSLTRKLLLP